MLNWYYSSVVWKGRCFQRFRTRRDRSKHPFQAVKTSGVPGSFEGWSKANHHRPSSLRKIKYVPELKNTQKFGCSNKTSVFARIYGLSCYTLVSRLHKNPANICAPRESIFLHGLVFHSTCLKRQTPGYLKLLSLRSVTEGHHTACPPRARDQLPPPPRALTDLSCKV